MPLLVLFCRTARERISARPSQLICSAHTPAMAPFSSSTTKSRRCSYSSFSVRGSICPESAYPLMSACVALTSAILALRIMVETLLFWEDKVKFFFHGGAVDEQSTYRE